MFSLSPQASEMADADREGVRLNRRSRSRSRRSCRSDLWTARSPFMGISDDRDRSTGRADRCGGCHRTPPLSTATARDGHGAPDVSQYVALAGTRNLHERRRRLRLCRAPGPDVWDLRWRICDGAYLVG